MLSSSLDLSVMSSTPSSSKICDFFDRDKSCRFGRRCKFLHIRSSPDSTENPSCSSKTVECVVEEEVEVSKGVEALALSVATTVQDVPQQLKVCFYFAKFNQCQYGKSCHFEHIQGEESPREEKKSVKPESKFSFKFKKDVSDDVSKEAVEEPVKSPITTEPAIVKDDVGKTSRPKRAARVCRYFKAGHCSMGRNCRFRHPENLAAVRDEDVITPEVQVGVGDVEVSGKENAAKPQQKNLPCGRHCIFILEELSPQDLEKCRSNEITQLKKRFPKCEENIDDEGCKVQFIFVPSDPDWPYDVKAVPLVLGFKKDYPQSGIEANLIETSDIPETVHRTISRSMKTWLDARFERFTEHGNVEQVVRPLLKWLDRNVEELFTSGLKQYQRELMAAAAGLTFVSATELQEQYHTRDSASSQDDQEEEEEEGEDEESDDEEEEDGESEDEGASHKHAITADPAARGTEVRFINLRLMNSLATLMATKVTLQIQCARCRGRTDVSTPVGRGNAVACSTCGAVCAVAFRAALVHANSAVAGYADVDGCTLHDVVLPACAFLAGCLMCAKEMVLEGVATGQPKDTWCRSCNARMRVVADSVRFLRLQPASLKADDDSLHKLNSKLKRLPKDPAIQDGRPLPDNGICKHYKKSYRWFRFPCCGKAYPCDVCHDEQDDHPYTYANRMICGHCAKEQPYSAERPCVRCSESLTKKNTSHWEGGKGCRDRIKMSRDDAKKYSNLNKTISKKAAGVNTGKAVTRLRHS